jgi:hypothetical protein
MVVIENHDGLLLDLLAHLIDEDVDELIDLRREVFGLRNEPQRDLSEPGVE